jgi:4-hydroxy-tetrahydrodipicolinate synthase
MMLTATPPAAIKGALNMVGLPAGVPRDPVKPLMPREEAHIRDILTQVGILDGPVAKRA